MIISSSVQSFFCTFCGLTINLLLDYGMQGCVSKHPWRVIVHHLCITELLVSETCDISAVDLESFPLKEKLRRNPLKMDAPEKILSHAHGKVRTVADFLCENGKQ